MEQAGKTEYGKARGSYYAICHCLNCGNEKFIVLQSSIKRGLTTSCGCRRDQYLRNSGPNNSGFIGFGEIGRKFWGRCQRSAERRGLEFTITIENAWLLFEKQSRKCAFTGYPLVFGFGKNSRTTASIDRIDNSKGYIEGNIQWVHKRINLMRNTLTTNEFIDWCRMVVAYNPQKIDF